MYCAGRIALWMAICWLGLLQCPVELFGAIVEIEIQISSNSDDAEEATTGASPTLNSSRLKLGDQAWVGLRFQNVGISQGENIVSAHLELRSTSYASATTQVTIFGQDDDDPGTFTTSASNISSRARTSASVSWNPIETWSSFQSYNSPDITAIIQEIVDRPGFAGDDIVILIRSDDLNGEREFMSHDNYSSAAASLHIEYGTPPEPTTYYVRPDGSNSNDGTGASAGQAWATLAHAVDQSLIPGDIVYVMAGTYSGEVSPSVDGTSSQRIQFIADRTGAIFGSGGEVILQASSGNEAIDLYNDDYLEFVGFSIDGNSSGFGSQAIDVRDCDGIVFKQCKIHDGGSEGVNVYNASVTLINCLIYDNGYLGVDIQSSSTVEIWNCIIANNAGDGVGAFSGTTTVTNSIIAYNSDDGLDDNGGTLNHSYNIVYGNNSNNFEGTSQGTGDVVADPLFTDAAGRNYTLQNSSPAINAGTSASGTVDVDIDDVPRPIGSSWDIGCYEYPLLGYWEFDEGSGATAADSSGNGKTASLEGSVDWEAARCGQAIVLDGSSDWVDLGQFDLGSEAYSVCAWFKTSASSQQTIFAATATGTTDHAALVQLNTNGNLTFTHRYPAASSGGTTVISGETYNNGKWHFLVAVKSTTELRLYVDGILANSASDTTAVHSSVDAVLGRESVSTTNDHFSGSLDEVSLQGFAMSDSEVAAMIGLLAYWKLDDATGSTGNDSSSNGYHLTLQGNPTWTTNGKVDGALAFDGNGDYATTNTSFLSDRSAFTIAAWIKADTSSSGYAGIAGQYYCVEFGLNNSYGGSDLQFWSSNTSWISTEFSGYDQTWTHVAVVGDGSQIVFYINGTAVHTESDTVSTYGNSSYPVNVGGDILSTYGDEFTGDIDDVRIYNRALCSGEIEDLLDSAAPKGVRVMKWRETE